MTRERISSLLWRLHLYRVCGWWDAGSDGRWRKQC